MQFIFSLQYRILLVIIAAAVMAFGVMWICVCIHRHERRRSSARNSASTEISTVGFVLFTVGALGTGVFGGELLGAWGGGGERILQRLGAAAAMFAVLVLWTAINYRERVKKDKALAAEITNYKTQRSGLKIKE